MFDNFVNIIGVIGALLLLFAYFKLTVGNWTGKTWGYQLSNLIAAISLIFYSYEKSAYVNVAINLFWLIIAVKGVSSIVNYRRSKERT